MDRPGDSYGNSSEKPQGNIVMQAFEKGGR